MQPLLRACVISIVLAAGLPAAASTDVPSLGSSVESLLAFARDRNPDYAAMRHEAEAAASRIAPAGALPDPKLRVELQDVTMGGEQRPTLLPNRVGGTRYQLMQDLPWFGKRQLKQDMAALDADGAQARARQSWSELASRIKTSYAQSYYLSRSERLTNEILDLMTRLEKIAQARYASGLAAQQDVIRAQVEKSNLRNELISLENERSANLAQLNMLLARPAMAPLAEPDAPRHPPAAATLEFNVLQEQLRARNPLLSADDVKLSAAERNRDLTYKNRYPDLTIGIAPIQSGSRIREWEVMVEVSIPLQQSSRRALEREAEAMLSAARARREATANQLLSTLAENAAALNAARRTETIIVNSLLPQAELTFKAALASYENGKVDFATLLDAQRQIRQARQSQLKAQTDIQVRLADIERLLGEE